MLRRQLLYPLLAAATLSSLVGHGSNRTGTPALRRRAQNSPRGMTAFSIPPPLPIPRKLQPARPNLLALSWPVVLPSLWGSLLLLVSWGSGTGPPQILVSTARGALILLVLNPWQLPIGNDACVKWDENSFLHWRRGTGGGAFRKILWALQVQLFCETTLPGPPPRLSSLSMYLGLCWAGVKLRTNLPVFLKSLGHLDAQGMKMSGVIVWDALLLCSNILFGVVVFLLTMAVV